MDQSLCSSDYAIQYAKDDPVVKRCLDRSSLYRTVGWMQFGLFLVVCLCGIVGNSAGQLGLAAMLGVCSVFSWIAELGHRKSAWIRTLELRIDELQRSSQSAS